MYGDKSTTITIPCDVGNRGGRTAGLSRREQRKVTGCYSQDSTQATDEPG